MIPLSRSLLRGACLSLAMLASVANAADTRVRLSEIAKEAQELVEKMFLQVRALQGYRVDDPMNPNAARVLSSGQFAVMDLQRNADRLQDLGSEASSRASKCDKSVRDVARDFHSQARRVNTATSRLVNSREKSPSAMTLDQVEFALRRAGQILPSLGSLTECSIGEDAEDEKNEKGTEDYDE
jgi:hypothetical protein